MVTLDALNRWLTIPKETENLEFKEAKLQYDKTKLLEYCVAIANERGGHLVLGVSDKHPRKVVGTQAFPNIGDIKSYILSKLHFRVDVIELNHSDGRVLVFDIPSRLAGQAHQLDGKYLMRSGEELVPMTQDQLRRIFSEGDPHWLEQPAKMDASSDDVIALLDTQAYFDLMKIPYPTTREGVLGRFMSEGFIKKENDCWVISNLAAILLAKRLDAFPFSLARKAPRTIIYKGIDKLSTQEDKQSTKGYAVDFDRIVDFIHSAAPQNYFIEQGLREEVKMFPKQAIRELIANALVHQDFTMTGMSVMIEMYANRLEISNPGVPFIKVERFIDEYQSRNEKLADVMRRLGICEEKGSGVDKVVKAVEDSQLPAPDFRVGEIRTTAILFAHQDFAEMDKKDRIRACYQHCCLLYVNRQKMSNQTLRERFKLPESAAATISVLIRVTKDAGLIKLDDSDTSSTRYVKYLPYWA